MTFCHFPATLWLYHGLTHCLFLAYSSVIFPFRHIASELSKSLLGHDDRAPGQRVNPWSILHSSFPSYRWSLSSLFPYPLTVNCFPYIPFRYLLLVVLWYYGIMVYTTIPFIYNFFEYYPLSFIEGVVSNCMRTPPGLFSLLAFFS